MLIRMRNYLTKEYMEEFSIDFHTFCVLTNTQSNLIKVSSHGNPSRKSKGRSIAIIRFRSMWCTMTLMKTSKT
jgi:hypothetical protein